MGFGGGIDTPYVVVGVGGTEVVYQRRLDFVKVGGFELRDFDIEIGGMDYGFDINGILGMDFLMAANGIINLGEMTLNFI